MPQPDQQRVTRRPFVEMLEPRRLLSAGEADSVANAAQTATHGSGCGCAGCWRPPADAPEYQLSAAERAAPMFRAKIDFLPESATTIPDGFRGDNGLKFGRRPNGLTYGWHTDNRAKVIARANPNSPGEQFDSFGEFVGPKSWWAIAVPNGRYRVRVVMGDPFSLDAHYKFEVEGVKMIDYRPTADEPWVAGVVEVNVKDGALAMKGAPGGRNNKISLVEITQIAPLQVTWSDATDLPARNGRVEPGVVQVGNKLYVFGGYRRSPDNQVTRAMDVLDFETGKWTVLGSIPRGAAESHAGVATDGTWIYWAGGQLGGREDVTILRGTNAVWRYHIPTNTWERYVDLPEIRFAPALALYNGVLYLFGGDDASRSNATDTHWVSSTRSRNPSWESRAPLPRKGDHMGVAVVNGVIYSIGGEDGHGTTYDQHADVFAYDVHTQVWTRKASMPTPSSHFEGATLVIGTKILVMGGRTDLPNFTTAQVRVYDTELDQWTVLNPLPFDRLGGVSGIYNGRVYFTQGYSRVQGFAAEAFWGELSGFGV
ncbi:MAG TPA: kelch repeat-containing protein [Tepidisphaeraceae bacterium]|nr:kelch repeat-containing protein [Tepidisphaeraceae bacterium]